MRIGIVDMLATEPHQIPIRVGEYVACALNAVPAFDEHSASIPRSQTLGGMSHGIRRIDGTLAEALTAEPKEYT